MTTKSEDIWICTECSTPQGRHDQWFTEDICEKCNEKMENKLPTAEELALQMQDTLGYDSLIDPVKFASLVSIEFAKLHVKEALKGAIKQLDNEGANHVRKTLINSYPVTNIK